MKSHLFFFSALLIFSIDASAFSGTGSGTSADPYVVTTAAQLNEVRNALTASYKLGADIDLTAWIATNSPTAGWEPIGFGTLEDPHPFKGTLDGDGHFITGLWSNRPDHNYIGLFGQVTGIVEFRNLGVVIAEGKSLKGNENVGGIVGWLTNIEEINTAVFSNCFVTGTIEGAKCVGGIVGLSNWVHPTIENCYAAGSIISTGDGAGGIIGSSWGRTNILISKSYAINSVTAGAAFSAGGILGAASANTPESIYIEISDCVAMNPTLDGGTLKRICAFVKTGGTAIYTNNYAFIDMLLNGDEEWFGSIDNNGGEDISAANLKQQTTYAAAGWDFPGTWTFGNGDYLLPVLSKLSTGLQPQILPAHLAGASSVKFPALDAVSIGVTNDELVILNKPVNTTAEVLDYSGRLLLKGNSDRYSITSLATGVYLLRVGSQTLKFIKK